MEVREIVPVDAATINKWVRPDSGNDSEMIVGRVVAVSPDGEIQVAWLSNERGLWLNWEPMNDTMIIPKPEIGLIEAIMVSAVPLYPADYDG